jgi:hypothetical protein
MNAPGRLRQEWHGHNGDQSEEILESQGKSPDNLDNMVSEVSNIRNRTCVPRQFEFESYHNLTSKQPQYQTIGYRQRQGDSWG